MIQSERLSLRPPCESDLPFIISCINTLGMMRHLGGEIRPKAAVAASLAEDIVAFADGTYLNWTILRKSDEQRIGRVGLFVVRTEAAPKALRGAREIGWMLAEPFQGEGYATEAARAVLAHGFKMLGCTEIFSQTSDSNDASTRMMARLGFARRADLDYVDPGYPAADNPTTIYRLKRGEWTSRYERVRD